MRANTQKQDDPRDFDALPLVKKKGRVKVNVGTLITLLLCLAIIVALVFIIKDIVRKRNMEPRIINGADYEKYVESLPTPTPTPEPLRPTAETEGCLPVFNRANTDTNKIAVTIGGSLSESKLSDILDCAQEAGARLTFFPLGKDVENSREIWNRAVLMGHEIESAGYSGKRFLEMEDDKARAQEVDKAIGVLKDNIDQNYELHFLRTRDMYDYDYPALHRILASRKVLGIASQKLILDPVTLPEEVESGMVIYMEIGNNFGVNEICTRIRALSAMGFELVTMNELFEYGPNAPSTAESD